MTEERIFTVCLPDPSEAMERLEHALFEFQSLLDYCAMVHPSTLADEWGTDLHELDEYLRDELHYVSSKYPVRVT